MSEIDSVPHTSVRLCHWSDRYIGVEVRRDFPVLEKVMIVINMINRRRMMSVNKTEITSMSIKRGGIMLSIRVAEVVRGHGGPPPKSLNSDENFKPKHTLFCHELRFVAI